ncbi:hypothetical protein L2091_02870 [Curtobacterium albidum]|uniref:hypothetical protein n=1 Tax=Curtobacterium citreum TaxID=2036 RepID=UPI0020273ACA|nr:hypothetical protein [Curtobacterium albidum]MCL9664167.1 hypothetical protein [Curtobacterium albidum]
MALKARFGDEEHGEAGADEQRLAQFGLSSELIHDALRRGVSRALSRTGFANPGAGNTDIYQDGSEDLRARLARRDWVTATINNQKRVIHPEGKMSIVVASADYVSLVGDPQRRPLTREKGPATLDEIRKTQRADGQAFFALPGVPDPEPLDAQELAKVAPLWMLLHQLEGRTLLLELAQPDGYRSDHRVDSWRQRIQLRPLVLGDVLDFPETPDQPDFDIPISRR